nr:MAG: replication associated protein [Cressdnaviricota sp.]
MAEQEQQHDRPSSRSARNFCFTRMLTQDEINRLDPAILCLDPFKEWHTDPRVEYLVYQMEKSPSTGKLHMQGFIHVNKKTSFHWIINNLGNNCHVEAAHDIQGSIAYCQKAETREQGPWHFGVEPKGQGQRTDLDSIYQALKEGKHVSTLMEKDPHVARFEKHIKFMQFCIGESHSDRQAHGVQVWVLWGDAGSGKTGYAINHMCANGDYFKLDCTGVKGGNLWFDGYEGQKTLILDDFDNGVCSISFLKTLLDKYKMRIPIKTSHSWAQWDRVIMTANDHPADWWNNQSETNIAALKRRINHILYFDKFRFVTQLWDRTMVGVTTAFEEHPPPPPLPIPIVQEAPRAHVDLDEDIMVLEPPTQRPRPDPRDTEPHPVRPLLRDWRRHVPAPIPPSTATPTYGVPPTIIPDVDEDLVDWDADDNFPSDSASSTPENPFIDNEAAEHAADTDSEEER